MRRIGIVCEGPTDRHAIANYVRHSLSNQGISDVEFCDLPAYVDNTAPSSGSAMVIRWLSQHPMMRSRYLRQLFAGNVKAPLFDALVIHLDADNLSNSSFRAHIHNSFQTTVQNPSGPQSRGSELRKIIKHVGKFNLLTKHDRDRHVLAVAVESTETWCVAAFRNQKTDPEQFTASSLRQAFMSALHKFEGRPTNTQFRKVSKDVRRRSKFCRLTAKHADRIEMQCSHYKKLITDLYRVL